MKSYQISVICGRMQVYQFHVQVDTRIHSNCVNHISYLLQWAMSNHPPSDLSMGIPPMRDVLRSSFRVSGALSVMTFGTLKMPR